MMESTRQQWRVYATATIALIVILLLTTHLSIRLQVREKKRSCTQPIPVTKRTDKKNRNASSNKLTDGRTKPCIRFHIRGYKRNTDKLTI